MTLDFVFRQIDKPRPIGWAKGIHWFVEAYDAQDGRDYPLGTAYCVIGKHYKAICFLNVIDQHRRQGVATALVHACTEQWPDILLTEAISKAGRGLLKSLEK